MSDRTTSSSGLTPKCQAGPFRSNTRASSHRDGPDDGCGSALARACRWYSPRMTFETRRIGRDELLPWLESVTTTFLERPDIEKVAGLLGPRWDFERIWGAVDGRIVGTLRTWATEVTVPGGAQLRAAAMTGVTVLPTHRRRGILRSMVAAEHAAARDRGEVLGVLHASEAPIYGRFGYGYGVDSCTWTLDVRSTAFTSNPVAGITIAPIDDATADLTRELYDAHRRRAPGEIQRRDWTFAMDIGLTESGWDPPWKGWVLLHRDEAGVPDGYVRYRAEEKWEAHMPRSVVHVQDFVALNDAAYDAQWRFLAEMDLVATVRAERRSPSERLPWILANSRAAVLSETGDGLWVALFDVEAALSARRYERSGELVLEIVDGEAGGQPVRVHLEAGPDGASCRSTRRAPDLSIHADALGAAYLGGTPLRHAALARGFVEHRPGSLRDADALFRTLDPPTCMTFF